MLLNNKFSHHALNESAVWRGNLLKTPAGPGIVAEVSIRFGRAP